MRLITELMAAFRQISIVQKFSNNSQLGLCSYIHVETSRNVLHPTKIQCALLFKSWFLWIELFHQLSQHSSTSLFLQDKLPDSPSWPASHWAVIYTPCIMPMSLKASDSYEFVCWLDCKSDFDYHLIWPFFFQKVQRISSIIFIFKPELQKLVMIYREGETSRWLLFALCWPSIHYSTDS